VSIFKRQTKRGFRFPSLPLKSITAIFLRHRMPATSAHGQEVIQHYVISLKLFLISFLSGLLMNQRIHYVFNGWTLAWTKLHTHTHPSNPTQSLNLKGVFFFFFAVQQLFHESYHAHWNHIFFNTFLTISDLLGTHLLMACGSPKMEIC